MLNHENDCLQWLGHSLGRFTTASAWNSIHPRGQSVPWSSFIWSSSLPPRYQTLLWLITCNWPPTQVSLLSYGRIPYAVCAFCSSCPDPIDHLFFGCHITGSLALYWAAKCNFAWQNKSWLENLDWATNNIIDRSFHQSLTRFAFGALCYIIWKERNNIIFRNQTLYLPALKMHLHKAIKDKALTFKHVPDTPRNRRLQRSWGLHSSIFDWCWLPLFRLLVLASFV